MPVTGFHSVIESPDSVNRVAPPTSTISAIMVATTTSQARTGRNEEVCFAGMALISRIACKDNSHGLSRPSCSAAPRPQAALSSEIPDFSVMTIRTRKFFGAIALIVLAAVWALTGMAVAQMPLLANSGLLQAIFYVVAGMGW